MNKEICVGVTGLKIMNSPQSGFGVARSLKEAGYKVVGIDSSQLTSAICSPYFDHVYTLKSLDTEDIDVFIQDLKKIRSKTGLSIIIPNCDREIYFFSRYKNELKDIGINILVPTLESLKQTSKFNLSDLDRHGLNIPKTVIASTENDLKTVTENIDFPIVCKGALADSYVAKDKVDLFIYFRKIDELFHGGRGNVIFQEYIKGDFYCTAGVSDRNHRLLRHFSMKKLGIDFKGSTWCGQTIQNKKLKEMTERFIDATGWVGPFEMEFIKDSDGIFWLFEINPRCPAYIYFAAATGQNLPDSIVRIINVENEGNDKVKKDFSYDLNMVFTRLTDEVVYPKKDLNSLDKYGKVRNLQTADKHCVESKNCTDIKTFYELLNDGDDDKVAVLHKSEAISYRELKDKINERCNELKGMIKKNDKVIIRSDETPDTIIDIYAIDLLGAVIVPVSPLSTGKDIESIIDDLKVNVMIYEKNIERIDDKATAELPDDACMIFYTSGTTGKPKCIIHTKQSILTPCYEEGKAYGISDSDIIGGTPSLSFTYGFGAFAIMPFMFGATVSMYPYSLSLKNFITVIRTIASHKVTVFFSIPTAYKIIVNMPSQLDLY
ncbi:MAG: AMP-binding protein, partial [Nanohaloarchaea archaeon]|nr:AMP-binding protein [Candidatus Nanohaloarchaea archaeon]